VGSWYSALRAHRLAPPDDGFADRLARLAAAAHERAEICRRAHATTPHKTPVEARTPLRA
jgi:hypothetical protein